MLNTLRAWTNGRLDAAMVAAAGAFLILFQLSSAFDSTRFPFPSFDSLQRVEAVYVKRERIPLRVFSRTSGPYGGGYTYSTGGGDNVLLNIKGAERWFLVKRTNPIDWSNEPAAETPIVAYHDGARIWQMESPEGSILDYQTLAAEMLSQRRGSFLGIAAIVAAGLILIAAGLVLIHRGRAAQG